MMTSLKAWYWRLTLFFGRVLGHIIPLRAPPIVFFFPDHALGGATRVHGDIAAAVSDQQPWIILTDEPAESDKFLQEFRKHARVFDLPRWPGFRWWRGMFLGLLVAKINRQAGTTVFGGNSREFYRLVRYFSSQIRRVDLTHSIYHLDKMHPSLPAVPWLDQRILVSPSSLDRYRIQYQQYKIPAEYLGRFLVIENGVAIPELFPDKQRAERLKVIYVGRGSPEKRVYLIGRVARQCARQGIPLSVTLYGEDVGPAIEADCRAACQVGNCVTDDAALSEIYRQADVLIMASRWEGFPLVIMEAMAEGTVPGVTEALGGIGLHIRDGENGYVITVEDEAQIVEQMTAHLAALAGKRDLLEKMSRAAYAYAAAHFSLADCQEKYRRLVFGLPPRAA